MTADPWLLHFRDSREYRDQFLKARRTDFLTLDPLSKHAGELRTAGLQSPEQLAAASEWQLSRYLKIDPLVAKRLIQLARLATIIPTALRDFTVEITEALLAEGIDSTAKLKARLDETGGADLASRLHKNIHDRCKDELPLQELEDWLEGGRPDDLISVVVLRS